MREFYDDVHRAIRSGMPKKVFDRFKVRLCKKHGLLHVPSDIELSLRTDERVVTKPVRSRSGVATLALMTAPFSCPHGRCVFCPGGPGSSFGDVPQSYTGHEPSSMRGRRNKYDPYLTTFNRLEHYVVTGHSFDKIEMIVQGGTFPTLPEQYQQEFVMYALKGLNDFGELFCSDGVDFARFKDFFELPGDIGNAGRISRIHDRCLRLKGSSSLEAEQLRNEKAKVRCVALCVETKPDWCFEDHIDGMLRLGATRVEMGVQCLDDGVLQKTHRGHTVADVVKATRLMRNSLLKVGYHVMPGLPGQTKESDISMFRELFSNPDFLPDAIKTYPTLVMRGTGLYGLWKSGKYVPMTVEDAADMIAEGKRFIPKWCRVMRVHRDIPSTIVDAGPNLTNMRQLVGGYLEKKRVVCKCIRCREPRGRVVDWDFVRLLREDYFASGGREIFLSVEDVRNDLIIGFCRLRIIPSSHRPEIGDNSAGIRELHVYGSAVPIGGEGGIQHRGVGRKLMAEAERIAREEFNCKKILVIAGVGVRDYYFRLGYVRDGPYVSKSL